MTEAPERPWSKLDKLVALLDERMDAGASKWETAEAIIAFFEADQPDPVKDAARVLLAQWEEHGEGVQGLLACYSLEGEDDDPGRMEPNIDGGWVKFDDVTTALRALAEQEQSDE